MAKINTGFTNYTDSNLSIKADYIIVSMTGNANFANPEPPLAEVQIALDAFNNALADSKTRSTEQVAIKNEKRFVLENLLTKLGLWVQLNGNDTEAVLLSSGFELTKKRTPVGVLPKPVNFVVKPGEAKGSIKITMRAIAGADSYVYEYTQAPVLPESRWVSLATSRASTVITNLTSGAEYAFKAVAIGANPTRVYSDEVNTYVL